MKDKDNVQDRKREKNRESKKESKKERYIEKDELLLRAPPVETTDRQKETEMDGHSQA